MKMLELAEVAELPESIAAKLESKARDTSQVALMPPFLRAYLEAPPDGVTPGLLVAGGPTRAVSAFARFDVHVDCLAPMGIQHLAAAIRRLWPGFLRARMLLFGLPAGLGGFDAIVLDEVDGRTLVATRAALIDRSLELLEREHATGVIWKELDAGMLPEWEPLLTAGGFLRAASVPTVIQELTAPSVDSYEAMLRSNYRHQLHTNLKRAHDAGLAIALAQPLGPWVERWYPLFLQVLEHSETRLETLTLGFFRALARDPRYVINVATLDGRLVGGAICTVEGDTLHFLYVGMSYASAPGCDLYFNLLYSVLRLALERGCTMLHWGQTSLDAKGRFGGVAQPLWFFIKFRRAWVGWLVRALSGLLFPQRTQTRRHVLRPTRTDAGASGAAR
jgi:hypothetical protein